MRFSLPAIILVVSWCLSLEPAQVCSQSSQAKAVAQSNPTIARKFEFKYSASITDVPMGAKVRVWIPVAETDRFQTVETKSTTLPSEAKYNRDEKYDNKILYFERTQNGTGTIAANVTYDVTRIETQAVGQLDVVDGQQLEMFLKPNANVPIDGKPIETFEEFKKENSIGKIEGTLAGGRHFYDFVEQHMKYDKSKPGYGNGDSVWACDSRTGNCTDFHSLFISVARANKFPAKFQIGFPLPATRGSGKIGGYHCWAQFFTKENGWVPVDISEADKDPTKKDYFFGRLNENRINFSTGRDIDLVPKQDGAPLNYFVYPHVEVDGKPYPKEKIKLSFSYKDHE